MADFIELISEMADVIADAKNSEPDTNRRSQLERGWKALQHTTRFYHHFDELLGLLAECKDKIAAVTGQDDVDCAQLQQGLRALRGVIKS